MMSGFKTPKFEFLWLGVQGSWMRRPLFPMSARTAAKMQETCTKVIEFDILISFRWTRKYSVLGHAHGLCCFCKNYQTNKKHTWISSNLPVCTFHSKTTLRFFGVDQEGLPPMTPLKRIRLRMELLGGHRKTPSVGHQKSWNFFLGFWELKRCNVI